MFIMGKKGLFSSLLTSFFVMLLLTTYLGCNRDVPPIEEKDYYKGEADLSVINMSTGDTIRFYDGRQVSYKKGNNYYMGSNITIGGSIKETPIPKFHPSEKMRLLFIPPSPFENNDYRVNFQFVGIDTIVLYPPYQIDITIEQGMLGDTCGIKCSAYSPDWDESMSKCEQECSIVVE